jgi:hypothetical protein
MNSYIKPLCGEPICEYLWKSDDNNGFCHKWKKDVKTWHYQCNFHLKKMFKRKKDDKTIL